MIATAISKTNKTLCIEFWIIRDTPILIPPSPINLRSIWPANIFTPNRRDRVRGRINLEINSITTINGISTNLVPIGTKWDKEYIKSLYQPNTKHPIHRGSPSLIVIEKCLVEVNTYGNKPGKLHNKININKLMQTIKLTSLECRININSFTIVHILLYTNPTHEVNHIHLLRTIITLKGTNQLPVHILIGSNTENKLVIIFTSLTLSKSVSLLQRHIFPCILMILLLSIMNYI